MKLMTTATVLAAALSVAALSSPAFADRGGWRQNQDGQGQNQNTNQNNNNGGDHRGRGEGGAKYNNQGGSNQNNNQGRNWRRHDSGPQGPFGGFKPQNQGGPQGGPGNWPDRRLTRGDNDHWRNQNNNNWGGNDPNRRRGDDRWRNNNNNQNWGDNRWRNRDQDRDWRNRNRDRDWNNDRRRHHHPRWWRPNFYYYGNYWYPHWYNNGWDDGWRYGIGLRFFNDLYWWNYENSWWFWDLNGACWRQGDPRWGGGYGYGWRDSYWPRQWSGQHWRFCYDAQDDSYKETVIPPTVKARVSVEAGVAQGWREVVGDHGRIVSIEHYGASADFARIFREFGVTAEAVADTAQDSIRVATG